MTLALLLAACGDCESGSPRIVGARSPDAYLSILRSFRESATVEICVSSIKVQPLNGADGAYNPLRRTVLLDDDLEGRSLERTLNHELCHALDLQNGLSDIHQTDLNYPVDWPPPEHHARHDWREAYALSCEVGLSSAAMMAARCDRGPLATAARAVVDGVVSLDAYLTGDPWSASVEFSPDVLNGTIAEVEFLPVEDGTLVLRLIDTDGYEVYQRVELTSGAPLPIHFDTVPESAQPTLPLGWDAVSWAVVDQEVFSVAVPWLSHTEPGSPRLLRRDPTGHWATPKLACLPERWSVFTAGGQAWLGGIDGAKNVAWGPII